MTFQQLNVVEPILRALTSEGYTTPTPVQEKSIPIALQGRDLLSCAQTGTGKTAAFAIPILQLLSARPAEGPRQIRSLILAPTRELAIQISESFEAYGRYTGLRHAVIFGGVSQFHQVKSLRQGVDILVATPGRLMDLLQQRLLTLQHIEFFVLDEADRMLDMGFIQDVHRIVAKLPEQRQTLFFSATMPPPVAQLANRLLNKPVRIDVTPVSSTAEKVAQVVYYVDKSDKKNLLVHLLQDESIETALVFTRTKHGADKLCKMLHNEGIRAEAIHGNKSQAARQKALLNFRSKKTRILVATDIAARGIDIDKLTHVFNYELPEVPETYVHRIGRTGRAGETGLAISFCDREEKPYLRAIHMVTAQIIPVIPDHPFPQEDLSVAQPVNSPLVARRGRSVFSNPGRTFRQR